MTPLGDRLRSERERQGYSLAKIGDELRISTHYLEAIEEGQIEKLPGGFFYRSFVRQYAHFLGIDESQIERELETITPPQPVALPSAERFPIEVPPMPNAGSERESIRRVPGSLIALILVIVACAGLFSLWSKYRDSVSGMVASAPPQRQQQAPPHPQAAPPQPAATTPAPQVTPEVTPQPQQVPAPAAQAPPPVEKPANVLPPQVEGTRFQVNLTATEDAWVQISSSGKTLYVGILKPGESKAMEAANAARLIVGNAGGLNVQINGQAVGSLGPRGQPRSVILTPAGVQPVQKPPE